VVFGWWTGRREESGTPVLQTNEPQKVLRSTTKVIPTISCHVMRPSSRPREWCVQAGREGSPRVGTMVAFNKGIPGYPKCSLSAQVLVLLTLTSLSLSLIIKIIASNLIQLKESLREVAGKRIWMSSCLADSSLQPIDLCKPFYFL